ncbi:radical SAM family heme chaperone HemW [Persicobacter psychrovividus]|uniref:Heme chaperone HemW n=1 Tax=Persicobacter psychrovividus TaxID=387638 RepID=A0ABN6LFL0_9BACT|nr:coproporphyrinogen III oxidase [Persicobacter psychrovividus]
MAGIYIHIPFCRQACYYCDFHFSTSGRLRTEMITSIIAETALRAHYLSNEPIETIYFGGGTPSLLTANEIQRILDTIQAKFNIVSSPEITLEANPDDLHKTYLQDLKKLGVNRLSIGIQSFFEKDLKLLHRIHDRDQALNCVKDARDAGFDNLNLDLIYAMPHGTDAEWAENLRQMMQLAPTHLSAYALTIEESTVFGRWYQKGKLRPVDEDKAADQLEMLMDVTAQHGYEHYEISNFCQPGYESKHNSSYWLQKKYLGLGPGAHSYNGTERHFNVSNNPKYVKQLSADLLACEGEKLTDNDRINEYLMTRLRTKWGIDLRRMGKDLHFDLMKNYGDYINHLQLQGHLFINEENITLTRSGKMIADEITEHLFQM